MPPRQKVGKLTIICSNAFVDMIMKRLPYSFAECERGFRHLMNNRQNSYDLIPTAYAQMWNQLLTDHLPSEMFDLIANTLLSRIRTLYRHDDLQRFCTRTSRFDDQWQFLAVAIASRKTQHLNIKVSHSFTTILQHLYKMCGLRTLTIDAYETKTEEWHQVTDLVAVSLGDMRHLTTFSMPRICNDAIIKALSDSCAGVLRNLDVSWSQNVTERSIKFLLKCVKLREVNLKGTNTTKLALLVLDIPQLQRFYHPNNLVRSLYHRLFDYENNWRNIDVSSVSDLPNTTYFTLRSVDCRTLFQDHVEFVCKHFLFVEHMEFFHWECCMPHHYYDYDLSILSSLNHLNSLHISSCDVIKDNFLGLLRVHGSKIELLEFSDMNQNEIVLYVAIYCPNVRRLIVNSNCFVPQGHSFKNEYKKSAVSTRMAHKPFEKLESFFWRANNFASDALLFVLANARNVSLIYVGDESTLTKKHMLHVLSQNPLTKLKRLLIMRGGDLDMEVVNILLKSCPKLDVLRQLGKWGAISRIDIEHLRSDMQREGYTITVS